MFAAFVGGIALGCLYAMAGIIYNMMYSSSKVLSLTTGHFVMLGGVFGAFFISVLGLPTLAGILATLALGAVIGALTELVAVRRTLSSPHGHLWLLSTLAVGIIIQQCVALWWGTEPRAFPSLLGTDLSGFANEKYWLPLVVACLLAAGLEAFSRFTFSGKALRALAEDDLAARARGINTSWLRLLSYIIAGMLGAAAGLAAGQLTFAYFALGLSLTLNGFVALAVGGLGSNTGALVGGIILGLISSFGSYFVGGEYQNTIALGLLILFLVVRPQGIWGSNTQRQV